MKPVKQTVTGANGNCFCACLASLLEVPLETIPVLTEEDWIEKTNTFLTKEFGLYYMEINWRKDAAFPLLGYHTMNGRSPRSEGFPHVQHAVVGKNGNMVHDPHPSGDGIENISSYGILVSLSPKPWKSKVKEFISQWDTIAADMQDACDLYDCCESEVERLREITEETTLGMRESESSYSDINFKGVIK